MTLICRIVFSAFLSEKKLQKMQQISEIVTELKVVTKTDVEVMHEDEENT